MHPQSATAALPRMEVFKAVEAWIFDLDNTLYPRHSNLFQQIDARIQEYVQRFLDVDGSDAKRIQKEFYRQYGTTLRGLMTEHDVDADDFLEFVHDIDHSPVQPDPLLGKSIARLPGRKYIFTNGSRAHAEKVAERLGFTDHFEDIFDIVAANLVPKPQLETYQRFINRFDVYPANAAMFEDLYRNLVVPKSIGMHTVLVVPGGAGRLLGEDWELDGHAEGSGSPDVDFVTDDLASFVTRIADVVAPLKS